MAQLRIEQVAAPDFSSVSDMLRNVNQSFNTGIESAKSILDKYNEGQQAKGDQALVGALAGLKSEEELANFLQTTDLASMNISDKMRENILGARATILGNDSTRDSNSRANALEGREAAEYADKVAARDELRGMTPAYVAALAEGQRYGTGTGGSQSQDVQAQVYQGLLDRGVPPHIAEGFMMNFQDESGFNIDITEKEPNVHGTRGKGLYQLTGDRREKFEKQFKNNYSIDNQLDFLMQELKTSESRAAAKIFAAQDAGSAGAAIVSEFLRPAQEHKNARVARYTGGQGWTSSGVSTKPITENSVGGQGMTDFVSVLQAGTHRTPDEAAKLYNSVLSQQSAGQTQIDTAEAKRQSEVSAAAEIAAIQNPNNLSPDAVTKELLSTSGLSPSNVLVTAGKDRSAFYGVIAPAIAPDTQVTDALVRSAATDATNSGKDPLARSFALAESFDNAENTGQALLSEFEVPKDANMDSAYVDRKLQSMADAAGITKGQMAATISSVSQGNFEQFNSMLKAAPDEKLYATIMSIAERNFGADAQAAMESQRSNTSRREAERASAELQLSTARTRAAKLPIGSRERAAAEAEINNLRDTILKGMTPQEREQNLVDYISKTGMGSRLQGLNPNSAEFFKAMAELEETIKADSTLSLNEKELLLRDFRG